MRREAALKLLQEHIPELKERYGVARLGIFGSVARDEAADEGDVDVVVEMVPDLFGRASLKEELQTILGAKIDLVRYWRRMNHYLKKRIDMEAHDVLWGVASEKVGTGDMSWKMATHHGIPKSPRSILNPVISGFRCPESKTPI